MRITNKNTIKLSQILFKHGRILCDEDFKQLKKRASKFEEDLYDEREIHLGIIGLMISESRWDRVTNYATSLAMRLGRESPLAWGALSLGLRRCGQSDAAKETAQIGIELCPNEPETMCEACRYLTIEGRFEEAKPYYDTLNLEYPLYRGIFTEDEEFAPLVSWIAELCNN